jgi:hypothetical protein
LSLHVRCAGVALIYCWRLSRCKSSIYFHFFLYANSSFRLFIFSQYVYYKAIDLPLKHHIIKYTPTCNVELLYPLILISLKMWNFIEIKNERDFSKLHNLIDIVLTHKIRALYPWHEFL